VETTQEISLCSYFYLKLAKNAMFLLLSKNRFHLEEGGWHQWEGRGGRERSRRMSMVQIIYIHVSFNEKMISVETVPRIRGRGMKETSGGGEFKYDIFDIL
jgi:hypothetical protein